MAAPSNSHYRGWFLDRANSALDLYVGFGGASDPVELLRASTSSINFQVPTVHSGDLQFSSNLDILIPLGSSSALEIQDENATRIMLWHTSYNNDGHTLFSIEAPAVTITSTSSTDTHIMAIAGRTHNYNGGTNITTAINGMALLVQIPTIVSDTSSCTITTASTMYINSINDSTNVSVTNNRVIDTESGAVLTAAGVWTDKPSTLARKKNVGAVASNTMHTAIQEIDGIQFEYDQDYAVVTQVSELDENGDKRTFEHTTHPNKGDSWGVRYGIGAENLPDFLRPPGDPNKDSVSGSMMAGFALAAIRYLSDEVDKLKSA
jgi:hypothetical protein